MNQDLNYESKYGHFNPYNPNVSYVIHYFQKPLNCQHDQNIAEKPVVHNILIDSLYFLASKRLFFSN